MQGLEFLHGSPLHSHGKLRSSACLVDARWVLKISDYGFHVIRENTEEDEGEYQKYKSKLEVDHTGTGSRRAGQM